MSMKSWKTDGKLYDLRKEENEGNLNNTRGKNFDFRRKATEKIEDIKELNRLMDPINQFFSDDFNHNL